MVRLLLAASAVLCVGLNVTQFDRRQELQGPLPPVEKVELPPGDDTRGIWAVVLATGQNWIDVRDPDTGEHNRYPVLGEPLQQPPPNLQGMKRSHRLWDVRPGDKVRLELVTRAKVERCEEVVIHRRPGGVVPPRPGEVSDILPKGSFTHRANAEQDHETHGTQLPSAYADPKSLQIGPPLVVPGIAASHTLPVAPLPRPVNRAP